MPLDQASRDTAAFAVGAAKAVVCADGPSRQGRRRRLAYSFNVQPGEKGGVRRARQRRRSADRRHRAAPRHARVHERPRPCRHPQIVATVTVNDQPVIFNPHAAEPDELVVARYRAAGPTRLGEVRTLRARRQGTHLLVSFDRVREAKSYAVLIALRDGLRTDYVITRANLNVVVPTVGPLAGRVIVRALGDNLTTADGPEAATSIAVPRPQQKRHKRHKRRHR